MSESSAADSAADHAGDQDFEIYLRPTRFIDCDEPSVAAYASKAVGDERDEIGKALKLYYAVRDDVRYDPYSIDLTPEHFTASACLERGYGFCITKATLLAAAGRAVGLPTRLGFADVRNHLCTERLREQMGDSDIFIYHGYAEFHLEGKWVKATPAFNLSLCEKFRVLPLEFDGRTDSVFHPFDADGRKHMEYVRDRGNSADVPYEDIRRDFLAYYPLIYAHQVDGHGGEEFEKEAETEALN